MLTIFRSPRKCISVCCWVNYKQCWSSVGMILGLFTYLQTVIRPSNNWALHRATSSSLIRTNVLTTTSWCLPFWPWSWIYYTLWYSSYISLYSDYRKQNRNHWTSQRLGELACERSWNSWNLKNVPKTREGTRPRLKPRAARTWAPEQGPGIHISEDCKE